jgi:tRNA pseudouridine55 synthase
LLGRATRLADFIQSGRKTYVATVRLGQSTETDDAEGAIVSTVEVPQLSESALEQTLGRFRGEILQMPPKYSALKVGGRRAYAVARAGGEVDLAARPITIHDLRLLSWTANELILEVSCSKGTYVRALARDIAAALGTVGHLAALTRTRVGPFSIEQSLTLDEIGVRGVTDTVVPASHAILDAPSFSATREQSHKLANGQPIGVENLCAESVWVYDPDGRLVCLAAADGSLLRPRIAL